MKLPITFYAAATLALLATAGCSTAPADSCSSDPSLACVSGSSGWSCTGAAQPEDARPDLICSVDNGAGQFCCYASGNSCTFDSSVACSRGASGYSCNAGDTPPDAVDSSLVCSVPTAAGSLDLYCCYTEVVLVSAVTCAQDPSVPGCVAGSYGFSCTGADSPDTDFSNVTCSAGVATASATLYCCSYQ